MSGFRPDKTFAAKHALIDVVNQIQCNCKKVIFTCGIFITITNYVFMNVGKLHTRKSF